MPKYSYTAVDLQNKKVKAALEARDDEDLRRILRAQNLVPLKYKAIEEKDSGYRLKANETAEFSRQLANMLGSGITVVRALEIIKDRDFKPGLKFIYQRLHRDVQQGVTLSEAMKMQPRAFPELLVNMYASGEASGQLERVSGKMAVHYEKEHRLNGKIKTAMTYPAILLVVTFLVVMIIFTVVLPQFFEMFKDIELPAVTQVIIGLSEFLQESWYGVIIGVLVVLAVIQYLLTIRDIALRVDTVKLRLPVIGSLLKTIYTARFSRTLSSLYSSGISMISALEITSTIIGNKYIESQFGDVIKGVRNGEPLSETIGQVDGFDKKLATTILIGEESGRLDALLESTAESFDYEAEVATGRLVQLVEPVMIVVMAVVVGTIMLAVMMPLMSLYQNVGDM